VTTAKIFLVGKDEENLTPMEETAYETEDVLQVVLARYPDLLAGDQINPEEPRRWLLVAREMGVPADVGGPDRWSLDHLFLDQDGMPTFVECKRAANRQSRREVIAQMLDYAANGTAYWGTDALRQAAAETVSARKRLLDDEIRTLVKDEDDIEGFWQKVDDNLRNGKVRLIFVADSIPKELRRSVEFLNDKMADVEVLAVEIKQYRGKDQQALVPRVVGLTEKAKDRKTGDSQRGKTNRGQFLSLCPPETQATLEMILDRAESGGYTPSWSRKNFSVRAYLSKEQRAFVFANGYPDGSFAVSFQDWPPILDIESRNLREKLLQYGVFRSLAWHLAVKLDAVTIPKMPEVFEFLLGQMDRIVKEY